MNNKDQYQPPYTLTPAILRQLAEISEVVWRYSKLTDSQMTPRLRRENRMRTIQASLAIENNTLTLEQVTAVIDGKQVLWATRAKFKRCVMPLLLTRRWKTGTQLRGMIC